MQERSSLTAVGDPLRGRQPADAYLGIPSPRRRLRPPPSTPEGEAVRDAWALELLSTSPSPVDCYAMLEALRLPQLQGLKVGVSCLMTHTCWLPAPACVSQVGPDHLLHSLVHCLRAVAADLPS